ncbi:MAG: PRC-barrel domain-containing protein [Pseudanabaenaceae cyanobacterium bins.68]|nr:PRC-barrel domain-containing protein [Pseudanabaenaceae cyanobacterium bins.68]
MTPFDSTPFESNSQGTSQRAAVLGIQVISKATGRRLGIISEVWLDLDQRQIMGFSVADRYIPSTSISLGDPFYMALGRISLLGPDAILVDNENVLEDILTSERYTNLIGCEVITESGEPLGKVRDYQFDPSTGSMTALILAAVGSTLIPDTLISTYELDVNEIIAVGRERIIVTEGMEERLVQLSKGILEKLGLGKPPWEQEFEDDYLPSRPTAYSDNALGTGSRVYPTQKPLYRKEEAWEEDNWQEERTPPRRARMPEPSPEPTREPRYERPAYRETRPEVKLEKPSRDYGDEPDPNYYRNAKKEIDRAWSEESKAPIEDLEEL